MELLTDADALAALEPQWTALARRASGATMFQTAAWILPWWRHFGEGVLASAAVWRDGALIGLAPAYVRNDGEGALIGSGNTDYVDALCDAPAPADVATQLVQRLANVSCERWILQPLDARSPLADASASSHGAHLSHYDVYPRLALPSDIAQLDGCIPHHHLAKLRRARRSLERVGDVTIVAADAQNVETLLANVHRLHEARWESRGSPGVLADARVRAFHHDVARSMLQLGALRMYELRVNGVPAASFYGFAWNGRTFYYIGGYDPAWSRYSVGSLVVLHAIEAAVRAGDREFDFLRGGERYKYAWGAQPASAVSVELCARMAVAATRGITKTDRGFSPSERVVPIGPWIPAVFQEETMSAHSRHTTTDNDEIHERADEREEQHGPQASSDSTHRSHSSHTSRGAHREPQRASDRDSAQDREYRDADGTLHHHTHKYMDEHQDD